MKTKKFTKKWYKLTRTFFGHAVRHMDGENEFQTRPSCRQHAHWESRPISERLRSHVSNVATGITDVVVFRNLECDVDLEPMCKSI